MAHSSSKKRNTPWGSNCSNTRINTPFPAGHSPGAAVCFRLVVYPIPRAAQADWEKQKRRRPFCRCLFPVRCLSRKLREPQDHLEQVSVHSQLQGALLELCQAPGDGKAQAVSLAASGGVSPDEPFQQFLRRDI